jgi:hypothetical protein
LSVVLFGMFLVSMVTLIPQERGQMRWALVVMMLGLLCCLVIFVSSYFHVFEGWVGALVVAACALLSGSSWWMLRLTPRSR